jgi:hypothetical protein
MSVLKNISIQGVNWDKIHLKTKTDIHNEHYQQKLHMQIIILKNK